jgi:hypothetical protein
MSGRNLAHGLQGIETLVRDSAPVDHQASDPVTSGEKKSKKKKREEKKGRWEGKSSWLHKRTTVRL